MPSSISSTSTTTSNPTTVPATPMALTPSSSTTDSNQAPRLPPSSLSHTCTDCTNKWVIHLSKTPLTKELLSLLQKGPNFAITPKYPHRSLHNSHRQASSKLPAQEADEFRSDVNKILKQQQQYHNNQCNLNPSQCRALTQLKQDNSRVVLTADKGVAMVIMDQEDYTNKALILLQDTNTYKVLPKDPTSQLKTNSSPFSRTSNKQEASAPTSTNRYTPPVQFPLNSMAFPKFTKQVHPLGPLFPVGGPSHMVLPRSLHTSSNPL